MSLSLSLTKRSVNMRSISVLCFLGGFVCLRLVYPLLLVSLYCSFLIAPSVSSKIHWTMLRFLYLKECKMNPLQRSSILLVVFLSYQLTNHCNWYFSKIQLIDKLTLMIKLSITVFDRQIDPHDSCWWYFIISIN